MLAQQDRAVIERFKCLMIERGVPVCKTILFGSRARGDIEWDSDYDVLVVVGRIDPAIRRAISHCAWEAGFVDCLIIVPVVVTQDEIENTPFRSSLLMQAVREDGIVV
jgi:predicted nucleotidyltransferase